MTKHAASNATTGNIKAIQGRADEIMPLVNTFPSCDMELNGVV